MPNDASELSDGKVYDSPEAANEALTALASDIAKAHSNAKPTGPAAPESDEPAAAPTEEETADAAEATEPEEASAEPQEEETPAKGRSSFLDTVLKKYDGDMDKLAEALVHSWASGAQMSARLEQLTHLVSGLQQAREEPVDLSKDPDIVEISEQIAVLDEDLKASAHSQQSIATKIDRLNGRILEAQGQRKVSTSEEETARLDEKITDMKESLQDLLDSFNDAQRDYKRIERQKTLTERQKERAAKEAEARVRESKAQAALDAELDKQTNISFDTAVKSEMERRGLPESQFSRLRLSLMNEFKGWVNTLPDDTPAIDFDRWVPAALDLRYGESTEDRSFKEKSKAKASLAKPRTPAQPTSKESIVPANFAKLPLEKRLEIARAHEKRMLG